jgi:hypothetical protein
LSNKLYNDFVVPIKQNSYISGMTVGEIKLLFIEFLRMLNYDVYIDEKKFRTYFAKISTFYIGIKKILANL